MTTQETANRFQQQGKMKVIKGSILAPENAGLRFVLSINNLSGKTDSPLFGIFDRKWRRVREDAKGWFNTRTGAYKLGAVNTTAVQSDTWVIHMLCQDEKFSTDLKGLEDCLKKVCQMAKYEKSTVHVSGLLVEAIPELTEILSKQLVEQGVNVYFYEEQSR
jgi:hypothetical protein